MPKLPIMAASHGATPGPTDPQTGEWMVSAARQPAPSGPFVSFSYSFTEVSLVDGQTQVRSRRARLVDGKLQSEAFEGTLDGATYAQAIADTQRLLAEQTSVLLRQFSQFLPFWRR